MLHAPWSADTRTQGRGLRPAIISPFAAWAVALALAAGLGCGPDRAKVPVVPPVVNGACCSQQNGACTILISADCLAQAQHLYSGDGTVCSPNPCVVPTGDGACCAPAGTCTVTTQANCTGTWTQAGVCTPNPCTQSTGSCCALDGTCTVTTQANCSDTWTAAGICEPNPCPQPPPGNYIATGQVGSLEAKEITTISGAGIKVPLLAVPKTTGGAEGKMTFSIERDLVSTPTLPAGHTKSSDIYRFGPDGFVFGRPVELKIPVLGDTAGKSFVLYRLNQTTGQSEPYGGVYDRTTKTIAVQTYKLSPWFVGTAPQTNTAWGAIEVTNSSLDQWLNLCVEQYTLRYPAADADFHGEASSSWAPVGEIGVTNHGLWFVPQGTYRLCAEMRRAGTISSPPGPAHHVLLDNFQVNEAWTYSRPRTSPLNLGGLSGDVLDSTCACTPIPTPSVGTGDVQVTLTWHSAQAIDLDLWVTEPGGEQCYYGHTTTATGGSLDIDNLCGNYVDGRPENIFWANAPTGEYKVEVVWYSDCGSGVSSLEYDVRVINAGAVRTFSGTIAADATVEVTRFTVAAGRAARFMPVGESRASRGPRPAKK